MAELSAPLQRAASAVLDDVFALRRGERMLLVDDGGKPGLAAALADACRSRDAAFRRLALAREDAFEPPAEVVDALAACDVALLATARSYTHSEASAAARARGVRLATSPGLDEARLVAGLAADYSAIAAAARAFADRLTGAAEVRVTAPGGTDLRFSLAGRSGHAETGIYTEPGAIGNLPAGEASIGFAPGSARGTLAIDGSYPGLGRLERPAVLHVEEGRAVRAEGLHAPFFEDLWARLGDPARTLAEFGVGVNPALSIVGHALIDEKVAGTIHLGFGNDVNFGGSNDVAYHADGTVRSPTVTLGGAPWLVGGVEVGEAAE